MTSSQPRTDCNGPFDTCGHEVCYWKEVAECVTRDKNDEIDKLKALLSELSPMLNPDANSRFEHCAELFYQETGYIAPGKSVPLEMSNSQPDYEERHASYAAWVELFRKQLYDDVVAAVMGGYGAPELQNAS